MEWVQFARVPRVPRAGEIVHASDVFFAPAGGGAVAAVQLRRLAGAADFYTALGTGTDAELAAAELHALGVTVHAGVRSHPQRRTFTFLDDDAERTITVLGERIVPHRSDPLPWDALGELDGIYLTGGDPGAVRAARAARVLVATPRALAGLAEAGVTLDVLVGSAHDPGEAYEPGMLSPEPRVIVRTSGGDGGSWEARAAAPGEPSVPWLPAAPPAPDGPPVGARSARSAAAPIAARSTAAQIARDEAAPPRDDATPSRSEPLPLRGSWDATPLPGPKADAYGCGDAFAAALTYGLGTGMTLDDAIALAARCGAAVLCGRGPYGAMLELAR